MYTFLDASVGILGLLLASSRGFEGKELDRV